MYLCSIAPHGGGDWGLVNVRYSRLCSCEVTCVVKKSTLRSAAMSQTASSSATETSWILFLWVQICPTSLRSRTQLSCRCCETSSLTEVAAPNEGLCGGLSGGSPPLSYSFQPLRSQSQQRQAILFHTTSSSVIPSALGFFLFLGATLCEVRGGSALLRAATRTTLDHHGCATTKPLVAPEHDGEDQAHPPALRPSGPPAPRPSRGRPLVRWCMWPLSCVRVCCVQYISSAPERSVMNEWSGAFRRCLV